jgi:VIT1/CCC1 family predicted Fe2+/Mn2+ transporter
MSAPSTTLSTTPQEAFAAGDAVASREVHEKKGDPASPGSAPEVHGGVGSDNIKSLIFGGVDGAITTFSTIASVAGGQMTVPAVLVLGFANLIAGIAMVRVGRHPALAPRPNPHPLPPPTHPQGVGDFMSSKAENDSLADEAAAIGKRFAEEPEKVRADVAAKLVEKGFEADDAKELVGILGQPQHAGFFNSYVQVELSGSALPRDAWGPARDGGVTFLSFLFFGSLPLWVYVIANGVGYHDANGTLAISAAATVFALALLGFVQGVITKQHRGLSALYMTVNGSLACAAAYGLAQGIMTAFGTSCIR